MYLGVRKLAYNKTTAVLNKLKRETPTVAPIASEMILPNHSGIHNYLGIQSKDVVINGNWDYSGADWIRVPVDIRCPTSVDITKGITMDSAATNVFAVHHNATAAGIFYLDGGTNLNRFQINMTAGQISFSATAQGTGTVADLAYITPDDLIFEHGSGNHTLFRGATLSQSTVNFAREAPVGTLTSGEVLSDLQFTGTTSYLVGARIRAETAADWSATGNDNPTKIEFYTQSDGAGDGLASPAMTIDDSQNVDIANNLTLGNIASDFIPSADNTYDLGATTAVYAQTWTRTLYGGDAATDTLDLYGNNQNWGYGATNGDIRMFSQVVWKEPTGDISGESGGISLMAWTETCQCSGLNIIIPTGLEFKPVMEYDTGQTLTAAAAMVGNPTFHETAAPGAHTLFLLQGFTSSPEYQSDHAGTGRPPTTFCGYQASPIADEQSTSSLTMTQMTGFETNAPNAFRTLTSTEQLRGGVTVTDYAHFRANSGNANCLMIEPATGSTITTEVGIDLRNISQATTNISLRSDAAGAYMTHAGDIRIATDNKELILGTGQDAGISYDGTDLVFNSSKVGTGTVKLNSANNWTANGAQNVTISNVAPAGVGTATISKWLTVKDNAGTVYYIPAWT